MSFKTLPQVLIALVAMTNPAWAMPAAQPQPDSANPPTQVAIETGSPAKVADKVPARDGAASEVLAKAAISINAAPGKGVTVATDDGRFSLQMTGRIVAQDALAIDTKATNEATVKTVRLTLKGNTLTPQTHYLVQLALGAGDFDTSSPSPIYDAWLEHEFHRDASVRIGQYFVPFDRARTVREAALQVVDRAPMLAELTLDRDTGITVQSNDLFGLNGLLSYNLGVFGGKGRNRLAVEAPSLLTVARVAVHPFGAFDDDADGDLQRLPNPRLAIGVAGAYDRNTDRNRATTGTTLPFGAFDYGNLASDLVFKYRGFSLLAETAYRKGMQNSLDGTVDGKATTVWSRSGLGYLVQAGMMVTDKLEANARWSQLLAISPTDPDLEKTVRERGNEVEAGLSYYLNGHLCKLQAGYAYQFGDGSVPGRHSLKTQLDVTF